MPSIPSMASVSTGLSRTRGLCGTLERKGETNYYFFKARRCIVKEKSRASQRSKGGEGELSGLAGWQQRQARGRLLSQRAPSSGTEA